MHGGWGGVFGGGGGVVCGGLVVVLVLFVFVLKQLEKGKIGLFLSNRGLGCSLRMSVTKLTTNKIKINGEWLIKDSRIRQGIVKAFQNLLSDPGECRASLMNLCFSRIT